MNDSIALVDAGQGGAVIEHSGERYADVLLAVRWEGLAHNTQKSYRSNLNQFAQFLRPTDPFGDIAPLLYAVLNLMASVSKEAFDLKVAEYLTHLDKSSKSVGTIKQAFYAIKWLGGFAQFTDAGESEWGLSTAKLESIAKDAESQKRARGQVTGLTYRLVDKVCQQCESDANQLVGLRDSAIIRTMSDCLLRVSELCDLNIEDVDAENNLLLIKRSKTDQTGVGSVQYLGTETVEVIDEYLDRGGLIDEMGDAPLFRRVYKGGRVGDSRLVPESVRRIIKARCKGIRGISGRVSGHSLRVGSAVSLAGGGATLPELQNNGRWKDSRMPAHYSRGETAKNSATARIKYGNHKRK